MRQIVEAFSNPSAVLPTATVKPSVSVYTMTKFRHDFDFPVLSPPQVMKNVLAEWFSTLGIRQAHVAETEKFSHVTVFFNGGREKAFEGEERVLIPSPKVATYDLKPEMSSHEVATALIDIIEREDCPFVMCNFAPPDMVGHTGKLPEAIKAVEATDKAIGLVYEACKAHGYTMVVTSDHGNAEKMIDEETGGPHTAHTCALVPLIVTDTDKTLVDICRKPALCDVAPTMLCLMNVDIPPEMSGLPVFE
jgi:2,3-bisphosphoglycerate-independent phosphoglycerate mutase